MDQVDIYNSVIDSIEGSISRITASVSRSDAEEVSYERDNSLRLLQDYKRKLLEGIEELKRLSESKVFTVALYGETNAGKSSIIEILRILFGEARKKESRARFRQIAAEIRFDASHIESLGAQISLAAMEQRALEQELQALRQQHATVLSDLQRTLRQLTLSIREKKDAFSIWQRIVYLFKKLAEEQQQIEQAAHVNAVEAEQLAAERTLQVRMDETADRVRQHQQDLAQIEANLIQLAPYQDGEIIGNGRSDFTLDSQRYDFEVDGQKFALIDVPGIEGNEKKVSDAIGEAVKTSHAVLYITRKPSPPNKGDSGQFGTIEKIQQHLNAQTEVWAVYNKGVTNPMALQASLINEGEAASLRDLDTELQARLGDSYQGCLHLSALPAFYAAADCFVPTNSHYKNRQKFLAGMDAQALLEKSHFTSFLNFISRDLCRDYQDKIRKSNRRKIQVCIKEGLTMLDDMIRRFSQAKQNLGAQFKSTSHELDSLEDGIGRRIRSRCQDQLAEAKSQKRQAIYSRINDDLSNDEFKQMLEWTIGSLKDDLADKLQSALQAEIEEFEVDVKEIVGRFLKNADELLDLNINRHFSATTGHFAPDFKFDSGINTVGLLSSLGGATMLIWVAFFGSNPVGWSVATVLGAVTLLFSFYKSMRGWLSSSYKREQQRKSADENLARVFDKVDEALDARLSEARGEIAEAMTQLRGKLSTPLNGVQATLKALQMARKDMGRIAAGMA